MSSLNNPHPSHTTPGKVHPDERAWIAGVRAGDSSALKELFHAYYDVARDVAELYVEPDVANDVVHDVFLRIWQRRAVWEVHGTALGYLCSAVRNQALNVLARAKRERNVIDAMRIEAESETGEVSTTQSAVEGGQSNDFSATIRAAIQSLPKQRRTVVQLRWLHGMTFAQIAQAMGVSIRTVETNHLRAMKDLRERLSRPS